MKSQSLVEIGPFFLVGITAPFLVEISHKVSRDPKNQPLFRHYFIDKNLIQYDSKKKFKTQFSF